MTASKLAAAKKRLKLALSGDPKRLDYQTACDLVQSIDEIVIAEIEGWQSVFRSKPLALPA